MLNISALAAAAALAQGTTAEELLPGLVHDMVHIPLQTALADEAHAIVASDPRRFKIRSWTNADVNLDGHEFRVHRPRVVEVVRVDGQRAGEVEVQLPLWVSFTEKLKHRQRERALELLERGTAMREVAKLIGVPRATASRWWRDHTDAAYKRINTRRLDNKRRLIWLDGTAVDGENTLLVAMGVDDQGRIVPLGMLERPSERTEHVAELFQNLVDRGLPVDGGVLVCTDGGAALQAGVTAVLGAKALFQRCCRHRATNIKKALRNADAPKAVTDDCIRGLWGAWKEPEYTRAEGSMKGVAAQVRLAGFPAVADMILETLNATLMVTSLGVQAALGGWSRTSNPIEQRFSLVDARGKKVSRWGQRRAGQTDADATMAERWAAAVLDRAEREHKDPLPSEGLAALDEALDREVGRRVVLESLATAVQRLWEQRRPQRAPRSTTTARRWTAAVNEGGTFKMSDPDTFIEKLQGLINRLPAMAAEIDEVFPPAPGEPSALHHIVTGVMRPLLEQRMRQEYDDARLDTTRVWRPWGKPTAKAVVAGVVVELTRPRLRERTAGTEGGKPTEVEVNFPTWGWLFETSRGPLASLDMKRRAAVKAAAAAAAAKAAEAEAPAATDEPATAKAVKPKRVRPSRAKGKPQDTEPAAEKPAKPNGLQRSRPTAPPKDDPFYVYPPGGPGEGEAASAEATTDQPGTPPPGAAPARAPRAVTKRAPAEAGPADATPADAEPATAQADSVETVDTEDTEEPEEPATPVDAEEPAQVEAATATPRPAAPNLPAPEPADPARVGQLLRWLHDRNLANAVPVLFVTSFQYIDTPVLGVWGLTDDGVQRVFGVYENDGDVTAIMALRNDLVSRGFPGQHGLLVCSESWADALREDVNNAFGLRAVNLTWAQHVEDTAQSDRLVTSWRVDEALARFVGTPAAARQLRGITGAAVEGGPDDGALSAGMIAWGLFQAEKLLKGAGVTLDPDTFAALTAGLARVVERRIENQAQQQQQQ